MVRVVIIHLVNRSNPKPERCARSFASADSTAKQVVFLLERIVLASSMTSSLPGTDSTTVSYKL